MRLSQTQRAARAAIERLAASALPPITLSERICAAITVALPNDGFRLFGVDPQTMLVNRLLAASDTDGWARREWLRDVYLAADPLPYVELPTLMRLRLPAVASHARQSTCWGYPAEVLAALTPDQHERAFHDIGSPSGGTILASFSANGEWVACMQLYRRDPATPFTRSDVAFVRLLSPLVGEALANALARERVLQSRHEDVDASGIIFLDRAGRVSFATPAGETWLDRLRMAECGIGNDLPTPIFAAIAGLRVGGKPSRQVHTRLRDLPLRVEATPGGSDDTVAVVIAPHQPAPEVRIPTHWPLTPQEREIAALIARGQSNRAIAETLFISENTVQTHLRHIYSKLEVSGRTQLLARLFRESTGVHLLDEGVA